MGFYFRKFVHVLSRGIEVLEGEVDRMELFCWRR